MSRMNPQEYQILQDNKFNLYCSVLGVKEQCTFAPDKKVIERAFRKSALKCHPDKGGDPVVFKKLNEAYNKLIGHIGKLEQQTEAIELANSILIEVSKTSVVKWHEKLKTRYGWFKTDNCKNIIFDGPFKQYMGRSKNTGNITVVLYEDPPDTIPKIHVRSSKYMAWIAEQQMPVHMHVEKGKNIQFDQWRIAHLAEFGICNFASAAPPTPTPEKKEPPKPKAKTPKAKRKEAREASERRSKTRRDSEPSPEPTEKNTECENNKENSEPKVSEGFSDMNGNDMKKDEFNQENPPVPEFPFNCGHCGEGFNNLMDYALHKKLCVPDEEFGFSSGMQDAINNQNKEKKVGFEEKMDKSDSSAQTIKTPASTEANEQKKQTTPKFKCEKCAERFTNMVWYAKHKNACKVGESTEPEPTSEKEPVPVTNGKHESKSSNNIPSNEPQKQSSPPKHSNNSSMTNGSNVEKDINASKENVLPMPKTSKNIRIDVDEKEDQISPNKNDQATKTAQNVQKDNDNIQNISKENVCPTQEKIKNDINGFRKTSKEQASTTSKETKNDNHISQTETKENITLTPMEKKYGKHGEKVSNENCAPPTVDDIKMDTDNQYHNDKNVEENTQKKNVQITKTGKVTKPAKAQKLSKDLADVDLKNKPEATCTVEDMDVDEPEISKVDTLKPTQNKNYMPMGSLLTNLPTTAKPPPESDMEMENTVNKSKNQVDKQNCPQKKIEHEVPDKKSKTAVKFNLYKNSNSDIDVEKKRSSLDVDALELSNRIFTHIDGYDEFEAEQAASKAKIISSKISHKTSSQSRTLGELDKEAIKITNVIFSNTNETMDSEDIDNYLKEPLPKPKAPIKSIMKKTSLGSKENKEIGKSDTTLTSDLISDTNCIKLKQYTELNIPKLGENQDKEKKEKKDQIIENEKFTNGVTVTQAALNKDLTKEISKDKDILVIENKESISSQNATIKKAEHLPQKMDSKSKEKNNASKIVNNENYVKTSIQKNGETLTYPNQINGDTPSHKTFTKNVNVSTTPVSKKKDISKDDNSNSQNVEMSNGIISAFDKPTVANKIGAPAASIINEKEQSCAAQIYKEKEKKLVEGKINESGFSTVKTPIQASSKKLEKNIEVKHATQCFVVNNPLSPTLNRKDIGQTAIPPQTDDRRLGSQSEIVLNKKQGDKTQITSVTKLPGTVNFESKKVVVVSQIPGDTKTKGENTKFLESSKNSYTSPQTDTANNKSNLNKDLEKMDKQHEVKMQNITKIMDSSKEKSNNIVNNDTGKSLNLITESRKVVVGQEPSAIKIREGLVNNSDQSGHKSLSLIPQALQQSYTSPHVETNIKSDLNKDLDKLDQEHAAKMKRYAETKDYTATDKKMGLANTEVHVNRPTNLGPSRFDNPSKYSTGTTKEFVPKRNDSVYDFSKESLTNTSIPTGISEKPLPLSYQISKSATTVLDTRNKSPELQRKKFDVNFNASPEPFFSTKSVTNASDTPSLKYTNLSPTTASSATSSFKGINENHSSLSTKSQSPPSKTSLLGSKSYSTMPSVSSLSTPSGSYSSSSQKTSPQSYSSPSFPTLASLPKPASYSSTSSIATLIKPTSYASPTLSSPSNYTQSSNFDNRAKSEGSTLSTTLPAALQSNLSMSNTSNKTSSDLYMKIQATKDKHKSDIQSAMSYSSADWKPPVIKQKFDRPDPTPSKYTMTLGRDKSSRMQDRERIVIDKLLTDRASRGRSDDFLKHSSSYRL